ncbi:MAG: segregation/condensation protein A [Clostridia bacterium]|nr:segregation/condensation protein A [Clostridia bacterium]
MPYVVSLKQFDGPLDLLLTLISRAKIDICDIFVSEITEQYLEYMAGVDELDMDSASEFLQMAATLVEIKSRALLPAPPKPEDPDAETPEQALIRQLTEYKAFKETCEDLKRLEETAKLMLNKLPEEYPLPPPEYELTGLTLEGLTRAFLRVLNRAAGSEEAPRQREIRRDSYTIQECMARIQSRLRKGNVAFEDLFEDEPCRAEIVGLFLGVLELLKLNRVRVRQRGVFGEIILSPVKRGGETVGVEAS